MHFSHFCHHRHSVQLSFSKERKEMKSIIDQNDHFFFYKFFSNCLIFQKENDLLR